MPTYEYKCKDCGHHFEQFQAISEEPITVCPKCKGKTERIISGGAGFLFKGSGFYITDYRSKDYKAAAEKEKTAPAKPTADSSKETKKTESKPKKTDSK